ncbi:hypothetical protein DPEC_G00068810 [Dallia pectoralis]|uniref:Uncharacterized protein n=1 Tax=Dallia pectoralis TaxID=75939 RepID=A0ACC2H1K5_DALPE|nr:hypothetical protein DPEC_G00068810 [Dallia pectoralis]
MELQRAGPEACRDDQPMLYSRSEKANALRCQACCAQYLTGADLGPRCCPLWVSVTRWVSQATQLVWRIGSLVLREGWQLSLRRNTCKACPRVEAWLSEEGRVQTMSRLSAVLMAN